MEKPETVPDCNAAVHVKVVPLTFEFNATEVATPLHLVCAVADPVGFGFTVTSTVNGVPAQPLAVGVTVYLTTPAVVVVFVKVCAIGPVTPVIWLENPVTVPDCKAAVHVKVVPLTVEFNVTEVATPLHLVCAVADPTGIGFTVKLNEVEVELHEKELVACTE